MLFLCPKRSMSRYYLGQIVNPKQVIKIKDGQHKFKKQICQFHRDLYF